MATVTYNPSTKLYETETGMTFQTHDQAASYLNPEYINQTVEGQKVATPVSILSSNNAVSDIQQKQTQLAGMTPQPAPTPTPTASKQTSQNKVTLTNENGQTVEIYNPESNKGVIEQWKSQGYFMEGGTNISPDTIEGGVETTEQRAEARRKEVEDQIAPLVASLDSSHAAILQSLGEQYNQLIARQEEANQRYEGFVGTSMIRSGASRYAPQIGAGISQGAVNAGIQKIGDLVSQRNSAIAEANSAYQQNKWTLFAKKFDAIQKINSDLDSELSKQAEETRKLVREQTTKNADEASIFNAIQGGDSTVAEVFSTLSGKVSSKTIKDFLDNMNITKDDDTLYKLSNDQMGRFISELGWSGDDTRTFTGLLNTNGLYTPIDTLDGKSLSKILTPEELKKVKSILYTPKKVEVGEAGEGLNLSNKVKSEINTLAKEVYGASAIRTKDGYNNFVVPLLERAAAGESADEIADSLRLKGQSTELTGLVRSAAQQITSDLSAEKTQTVLDKLDDTITRGDISQVRDYLKKIATDSMGVDDARSVKGSERTVEFLDEIYADLKKFEDDGGDTNIFTGTMEDIARKVGTVKEEELRTIATKILAARQKYRRAMTGVAFSPGENMEYDKIFPNIDKTQEFNSATIDGLRETLRGEADFMYEHAMGTDAYNAIFKNAQTLGEVDASGAKSAVESYLSLHPDKVDFVSDLYETLDATDEEIYEYLRIKGLI